MNGSSRCSGSVEVLLESWEPACAAHWNRDATEAVCKALDCGDSGKVTYLMPPTSELPPGATSGNTSSAGNTTWAQAPTVRCRGADWQLCKVQDQECSSDRQLVWVTCAGTRACLHTYPTLEVLNIAAKPWSPDFHPPASQVMQTYEFHIVALIKLRSFSDLSVASECGLQTPQYPLSPF